MMMTGWVEMPMHMKKRDMIDPNTKITTTTTAIMRVVIPEEIERVEGVMHQGTIVLTTTTAAQMFATRDLDDVVCRKVCHVYQLSQITKLTELL